MYNVYCLSWTRFMLDTEMHDYNVQLLVYRTELSRPIYPISDNYEVVMNGRRVVLF